MQIHYTDMEHGDGAAAMHVRMAAGRNSPDDLASCSCDRTMSTQTPPATAGTTTDAPTDNQPHDLPPTFGIDSQGRRHRWMRGCDRIVVTDGDGTVVHATEVSDRREKTLVAEATGEAFSVPKTVADWVRFVDENVAWVGTWLDADNYGEAISRAEAAAAEVRER